MEAIKRGQIVKFHTPYEDEHPEQAYAVLEVFEEEDRTRAKILALNMELSFAPISVIYVKDLKIDEIQTKQLELYLKVTKD